ncbi:MAG TPA: hypothetical protein PKE30_20960 [Niabella sp.]|nr:hypothetical protein [Niabella sp.]
MFRLIINRLVRTGIILLRGAVSTQAQTNKPYSALFIAIDDPAPAIFNIQNTKINAIHD